MRTIITGIAVVVAGTFTTAALAQGYPEKQIRFICPYAPGGTTDILTRAIAQKLTESMK